MIAAFVWPPPAGAKFRMTPGRQIVIFGAALVMAIANWYGASNRIVQWLSIVSVALIAIALVLIAIGLVRSRGGSK